MFRHVSQSGQTLGNISEKHIGKHQMFLNLLGNIFASREANFVSATMFPWPAGWANRETFEETSRITNVSATMFPSSAQGFTLTL
jgi:hypothetical protein